MYQPSPTDYCRCHSGKLYRNCCQNLTKLPKNASKDLRRRFWGKIIDECLFSILSDLDEDDLLESLRDDALESLEGELYSLECATDEYGLPLLDAYAIFHYSPVSSYEDDEEDEDDEEEEDKEDAELTNEDLEDLEEGGSPAGAIYFAYSKIRFQSPKGIALQELIDSPISWFRVLDVVRGEGLRLFDELSQEEVFVDDVAASLSAQKGAILCAKVLCFEGVCLMFGAAQISLPPGCRMVIEEMAQKLRETLAEEVGVFDREAHLELAPLITTYFFDLLNGVSQSRHPQINNTDGDSMEPKIVRYCYDCDKWSIENIGDQIRSTLPELDEQPPIEFGARDLNGQIMDLVVPYIRKPTQADHMDSVLVARFEVTSGYVDVEVNSTNRAEEVRRHIEKHLSNVLTFVEEIESGEVEIPSQQDVTSFRPEGALPPEVLEALNSHIGKYQEKWLDTPIPALGGKTPKQAAQDPKSRPQLEALLDDFAIREEQLKQGKSGAVSFNLTELRTRLGFLDVN